MSQYEQHQPCQGESQSSTECTLMRYDMNANATVQRRSRFEVNAKEAAPAPQRLLRDPLAITVNSILSGRSSSPSCLPHPISL